MTDDEEETKTCTHCGWTTNQRTGQYSKCLDCAVDGRVVCFVCKEQHQRAHDVYNIRMNM